MALDRERIVAEAVALLDAEGLDNVTTRKLAARLGVQSPTLYWHLPNKAALVSALAEAVLEQEFPDLTPRVRKNAGRTGSARSPCDCAERCSRTPTVPGSCRRPSCAAAWRRSRSWP